MKLSGHNFNNELFDSLLDGISKDVKLEATAQKKSQPEVDGFFSSTTAQDLHNVQSDELDFIAQELIFAGERAKVAINTDDLAKFAQQVQSQNLRGKKLERAAQKYCGQLDRAIAPPQGTTRISAGDLIDKLASHKVIPAGYNPELGTNDKLTGKYMGSSKNPNSIWDTEALRKMAQVGQDDKRTYGDEEILKGKQAQLDHESRVRSEQEPSAEQLQTEKEVRGMRSRVANITPENPAPSHQKLPENAMGIFSNNRDFENIPKSTVGENIIAAAEERANKKLASRNEPRDIQRPMNTKDSLNKLFGQ